MMLEFADEYDPLGDFTHGSGFSFTAGDYADDAEIVGSGTGGDPWMKANKDLLKCLLRFEEDYLKSIPKRFIPKKLSGPEECRNLCEHGTKSQKKKYCNRKGPPYPANAPGCHGRWAQGRDHERYVSKADKNGVYSWKKVPRWVAEDFDPMDLK